MVKDPEQFDKVFVRCFVPIAALVFTVLPKMSGMPWRPAVAMGLTIGVASYVFMRLTGGPSRYMGLSADGVATTMPPRRTLVLLGAGIACLLLARATEGALAGTFTVLGLLAGVGILLTRS